MKCSNLFSFYIFLFVIFTSNALSLPPAKIFGILNTWSIEHGDDYLVQFNPTDGTYNKLFDVGHFDVDYYRTGFYDENKHTYYWTSGCSGYLESVNLVTSKLSKVDIPACIFFYCLWSYFWQRLCDYKRNCNGYLSRTFCIWSRPRKSLENRRYAKCWRRDWSCSLRSYYKFICFYWC